MRRFALIALGVLLSLGLAATPVSAGKGWCRSDPIVSLNGVQLQFWVAIPIESQADVIGPIQIMLLAPRNTNMTLVSQDAGFNGYGESINLASNGERIGSDGSFNVTAEISVPMRGNQFIPLQVEVIPSSGVSVFVEGHTVGVTITLRLLGSTISDTDARAGTVIDTLQTTASTATPTEVATATATETETPTTEPTEAATEQATEEASPEPTTDAPESTGESTAASDPALESEPTATPVDEDGLPVADEPVNEEEVVADGEEWAVADGDAESQEAAVEETSTESDATETVTEDTTTTEEASAEGEQSTEAAGVDDEAQPDNADSAGNAEAEVTPADDQQEPVTDDTTVDDDSSDESTQPEEVDPPADVESTSDEISPPTEPDATDSPADETNEDDADDETPTPTPSPTPTSTPDDAEPSADS